MNAYRSVLHAVIVTFIQLQVKATARSQKYKLSSMNCSYSNDSSIQTSTVSLSTCALNCFTDVHCIVFMYKDSKCSFNVKCPVYCPQNGNVTESNLYCEKGKWNAFTYWVVFSNQLESPTRHTFPKRPSGVPIHPLRVAEGWFSTRNAHMVHIVN